MKLRFAVALAIIGLAILRAPAEAEFPYPANPQPCSGPSAPPTCINATDFARYLFLPATSPPTRPSDFNNDWKVTSDRTGNPLIDDNPQELFGVTGASVDLAWQVTTGRPDVLIAVLDSGIRWQDSLPDIVAKFYLNRQELPVPEDSTNTSDPWDRDGNGVFNIRDYLADAAHAQDSRVSDQNGNGVIDPEDLIFLFSDGVDNDANGYIDDISGWDFFEDDNDALDEVRYGHGTGEAHDSTAEANNGGDVGTCPNCQVLMVRVGDSFVAEANAFGVGVVFAVDSGAKVVQEALGTLNNSSFGQTAVDYAYRHGVAVIASAADEESNHHNYPANYNHTVIVNSVTRFADIAGVQQSPPSYLYLNGCTNYSPHVAVAVPSSSCSSEATGKGAGMAALLYSAALNEIDRGTLTRYPNGDGTFAAFALSADEVKQFLTMGADDINFDARPDEGLPQNYSTMGDFPGVSSIVTTFQRFPSIAGYDQYFGYGRVNAYTSVRRVAANKIPPEAAIDAPNWFQTIDPDSDSFELHGRVAANRAQSFSYRVEVAPGVQPKEADFQLVDSADGQIAPRAGILSRIPIAPLAARMPHGVEGSAVDASGAPDPDRFTFTVRVRVTDNLGNVGEDRHALFLHRDADLMTTTPFFLRSDGSASPVLADINGDGIDEILIATADGQIHAFQGASMLELPGWPVNSDPLETHNESAGFYTGGLPLPLYADFLAPPAVGDLDGDGSPEVVAADLLGRVYVWNADGSRRAGFPVKTRPEYSNTWRSERDPTTPAGQVPDRTNRHDQNNRLSRSIGASPVLGNLDGSVDGSLEIIAGAADRHVYAWHADGSPVRGWPVLIKDPAKVARVDPVTNEIILKSKARGRMGTKIIVPPSLGDIDGDGTLNVIVAVNEAYIERTNAVFYSLVIQLFQVGGLLESGNGRVYALHPDGTAHGASPIDRGWNPDAFVAGWPAKVTLLTTELLPTVGTGVNGSPALADINRDGIPEIGVFGFLGPGYVLNGNGQSFFGDARPGQARTLEADTFGAGADSVDAPAFPALGAGVFAEMAGVGSGFQFIAPTSGIGKSIDASLPAQQLPADNQMAVWDVANPDGSPASGAFHPGFPHRVNDLQFFASPAIADITGDGIAEAIAGSGVYDMHAVDLNGIEAPGWPKFTGGWTVTTAAVGDVDGDGRLEVVGTTREGYLFIWRTAAGECSYAPWRQYHHDERSTGNYDTDARPPAAPRAQGALLTPTRSGGLSVTLAALPGDDQYCGALASVDFRYATQPITNAAAFNGARRLNVVSAPSQSGRTRTGTYQLQPQDASPGTVYIAARAVDDAANISPMTLLGQTTLLAEASPTATVTKTATPPPTATPTLTPISQPTATAPAGLRQSGCAVDPQASTASPWALLPLLMLPLYRRRRRRSR
jgi:hypothetical protein